MMDRQQQKPLKCDDLNAFRPDSLTTVLLVKEFKKGDVLRLPATRRRRRRLSRPMTSAL